MDSETAWMLAQATQNSYDTGWVAFFTIGYLNSWVNDNGPAGGTDAGIRRIGNVVYLGGTVQSGASGTQLCSTLPPQFWPPYTVNASGVTSSVANDATVVHVTTTGVLSLYFTAGGTPGLDGIQWLVN